MTEGNAKVLVVDDEPENCFVVAKVLEGEGYAPVVAYSGADALDLLETDRQIQLVLLDIRMPGMDGVEVLSRIRERNQELPVVIVSAFEQVSTAVKCMRLGAYDYLTKPLNVHELKITVANTFRTLALQNEVVRLRGEIVRSRGLEQLVGASPAMQQVASLVERVAQHDIAVLLTGDGGTGKELVAGAIHALSPRRERPFAAVDCATLPEPMLEAELFGSESGGERRHGRLEELRGGTLFLDEVGGLGLGMQVKLLAALRDRQASRVGGRQPLALDVRVLAASSADLRAQVRAGSFREDLYHYLNEFSIHLPPLRERGGDVELLASHFLHRFNAQYKRQVGGFSRPALECMRLYPWPGNVRELLNAVKRAVVLAERLVEPEHLPAELRGLADPGEARAGGRPGGEPPLGADGGSCP